MSIFYQEQDRIFTLHTAHSTYQMKVDRLGVLLHLYYGTRTEGNLDYLLVYRDRGFSGAPEDAGGDRTYSLDVLPQEYPALGTGDYRSVALTVRSTSGLESCDLRYVSHAIRPGKYALEGLPAVFASEDEAETLEILLADAASGVQVQLLYGVLEKEDIITRAARIINRGTGEIVVEKAASACLDFVAGSYDLLTFYGRHTMERNLQRTPVSHGSFSVGSRRGASSHQYNPAVILSTSDATETSGHCYGMMFMYSGNFLCEAAQDQFDQTRLLLGLQSDLFHYPLAPGQSLTVPETVLSYSATGFDTLSDQYHRCIRDHVLRGKYSHAVRPVLVNSWEANYFHFSAESLLRLAREAADLGLDMLVLDDGWFGKRDDDVSGLGDWVVNEEKLGCSLGELAQKVNDLGLKFGLWIEPEMISEDSDLYRAHPDWAMQIPGRKPVLSRSQLVLDFSRAEIRDHVFDQICGVLDSAHVEYIKWDMNRSLSEFYSAATRPGCVAYDYMLGVYEFLEKLTRRYPDLLIEGCSGGGGRFDAGMLYYTPQIWCSDNTDAVDRLRIQYGTSFFYPVSAVGAHVSAVPNHQTGRTTTLNTRGVVAMAGTFGYELDLGKLTDEEKSAIRAQIVQYKRVAPLVLSGRYARLSDPFCDAFSAWQITAQDGSHALVSVVMLEIHGNMTVNYLRLRHLDPTALYEDIATGRRYVGSALMLAGLPLPIEPGEYCAYQLELRRCDD
jgi:alpha-galactosidase